MSSPVVGTGHLVRLILRRDRIRMPIWVLGIVALLAASAQAILEVYDTEEERAGYTRTVESSGAGKMMNGVPYDTDTVGGITSYEVTSLTSVLVALMVVFLVVRHTRAEEETGRAELLRATVLGRHAATLAAVLVAVALSLLVGILDTVVFVAFDAEGTGAVAHGASVAATGVLFTGVAAAAAQLTSAARGALGIAIGVVGVAFVLRGLGAVSDSWLLYLSPFAWVQEVRPFGPFVWWWLVVLVAAGVANLALAAYLTTRRDAGAGLWQPRPGPARAAASLGTPWGLAWRLQRGLVLGWAVGLLAFAALFGSLGREVVQMVEDNPEIAQFITSGDVEQEIVVAFFGYSVGFLAVLAGAFTVASVLRLRAEEAAGRAEALLATGLPRARWAGGALLVSLLATVGVVMLIGLGLGGTHLLVAGEWDYLDDTLAGMATMLPAVLFLGAFTFLLVGWAPRLAHLGWVVFGVALLVIYLGDLLELPDGARALSPYWHLPVLPGESFEAVPVVVLLGLSVVLTALGFAGLRRRDVASAT